MLDKIGPDFSLLAGKDRPKGARGRRKLRILVIEQYIFDSLRIEVRRGRRKQIRVRWWRRGGF